ncbi:MAG: glycosyltransferase family 39 protein [Saprospiraceae bacterium]|nr:glycosyltransferase family 39 protein [Candidatus Opimibacter iunctus]
MSIKNKNKGSKKPETLQAPTDRPSGNTALLLTSLAIVTTLIALISRIFLSAYPMNRDEGTYGYLGGLSVKGSIPYVDFYEMKPPVLYYLYGIGGTLFGFSDFGLRFFGLLLNLASGLLIYLILTRYIDKTYALVSSALFAMLSINLYALGFTMVAEHIVNTFVLLSFYLLIRSYDRKGLLLILLAGAALPWLYSPSRQPYSCPHSSCCT